MASKPNWSKLVKNLKGYNESKQNAEENPGGNFPVIPNGQYDARVVSASVQLSKNKEAMAKIDLIIIGDSEQTEKKISAFIMLEGAGVALNKFIILGYDLPESSEEIGNLIEDLGGSEKEVSITVKSGFASINGLVDEAYIAEEVEDEVEEIVPEDSEDETEESEEDDVIDAGDDVDFEFKGEKMQGTIISTDEKTETAKIKSGAKTYTVKLEKILGKVEEDETEESEDESEEEEESEDEVEEKPKKQPAPKKGATVAKKVTKQAPAKKTATKKK